MLGPHSSPTPRARAWSVLVCALAVSAAWAPAARAAWSAPVTVSAPHDAIDHVQLVTGLSGEALLAWHHYDLVPPAREIFGAPGTSEAIAAPGGAFGAERSLPASYASGPLVDLGQGRLAQLILRRAGPSTSAPEVALGSVAGVFAAPLRIHASVWGSSASLAGNSRGELLLAWISQTRSGRRRVWASLRLAGRRFGAPQLLSTAANAEQVTASVGPPSHRTDVPGCSCDMAVAFPSKRGRLLVRIRPHGPRSWGPVEDVGPAAIGHDNEVALYIGRNSRVTVAWHHQQLSEGGPLGPGYTHVAVQPPGAHRFLRPQTLERDPNASMPAEPLLVADNGRGLTIAFVARPGSPVLGLTPTVLKVAYSKGDRFGTPQRISPPGQQVSEPAAAEGPSGDIVIWSSGRNPPTSALAPGPAIYAAISGPFSNRLGAAHQISRNERPTRAEPASYPGAGWVVAWAGRPEYKTPMQPARMVVRTSSCQNSC